MRRIHLARAAVLGLLFTTPGPALACGFIDSAALLGRTFREDAADSKLIVYGTLANLRGQPDDGSVDVLIDSVIKPHPILGNKKVLKLSRYLSIEDPKKPPRMLIFCDIDKGQIDPFRGVEVRPAAVGYLKGLLAFDAKDHTRRLRYYFDFLEHTDKEIANDAHSEFMKTTDRDLNLATRKLPPEKLRVWIKDPKTPASRLRLYGFLLGNCGVATDAVLLRALAERLVKDPDKWIDGILTGCTLLDPKNGWAFVRELLGKASTHLVASLQALRAARYLYTTRPDVVGKKDLLAGISIALGQEIIADIAIEYLRAWRCWDLTDYILALDAKPTHDTPLIHRFILRYALQGPGPAAAALVAKRRKANAAVVAEEEEALKEETKRR